MVEHQPSKLIMWVRSPSPAPFTGLEQWVKSVAQCGQIALYELAHIAQAVEHSLGKGEVTGSSPVMGTIFWVVVIFFYNLTSVVFGDWHVQGKI